MTLPDFRTFAQELHQRPPYAWQERAAAELATDGWWPALRAPTGAGKTTLLDCWLHAVAATGPDLLGRRLVWVVDRRAVVDQVHAYAQTVLRALSDADAPPPVRAVREALTAVGGGAPPRLSLWRGGMDDEAAIAMREPLDPAAVAIVVSTVDQVGSRLLFRGYGLGASSRALHAGLLGSDTTLVLDEAHISEPLRQTVARIAARQCAAPSPPRPPLRLCPISATHDARGGFELAPGELSEPSIARRLTASKRARLAQRAPVRDLVASVRELGQTGAKVIGVVLNTVDEARAAFDALSTLAPEPLHDRVLLVGPVRALDRADLIAAIPDRAARDARKSPFVVVATQTIEVGVDLDFDALVTACAPLDALVQRFGRLDRAGALGTTDAVVVAPPARGCPVYGDVAGETWAWLEQAADEGIVDFSVAALAAVRERVGPAPDAEPVRTIALLDLHVDALSVTDAADHEGPAVELFLHGDRQAGVEMNIAWRDLDTSMADADVRAELDLRPLHPAESLTLSLRALQRWLASANASPVADVESLDSPDPLEHDRRTRDEIVAWRLAAGGAVVRIGDPRAVGPTDRVVISSEAGGLDAFGWAPRSRARVEDLGSLAARGPRAILDRTGLASEDDRRRVDEVAVALAEGAVTGTEAARSLERPLTAVLPPAVDGRPLRSKRIAATHCALVRGAASLLDDGRILVVGRGSRSELAAAGRIVTLDDHQRGVEERAARTLEALGVHGPLAASVRRAARRHDEGKRDPRFQAWLRGGRTLDVDALAKAAYRYDPVRVRRLREASGWPAGKRHELVSAVAIARAHPDDVLAAWLVATHHGRSRPFPDAVADPGGEVVTTLSDDGEIDVEPGAHPAASDQLTAFDELTRQHGPWGLALLEAVVVAADRAVSAAEAGA